MRIQKMFQEDINRKINGVVKVDQDEDKVLLQELDEYVITKELKKHFITFFNNYTEALDEPTADIGVWISGFFGSGKSHFLKMLSYLLENKTVQDETTVERFRKKFYDDPATFMMIDRATQGETDTILFNIDIEGSINKDKTAVLRVFAKMFYNYLGFYGENLKVAKLEQFIAKQGKTEDFHRVFEKKNAAYFGRGVVFNKFTGARGKSGSNDANAEYIGKLRKIMDDNNVAFQTAELGKVDIGGGGTIAYILSLYGMNVIDSGVAVLNMHAPWEITSKADVYEAYKSYKAFLKDA